MSDLFKNIKKSAKMAKEAPVPEGAWDDFVGYSERRNSKGRTKVYPIVVSALTGLLLMSNVAWWSHSSELQNNSTALRVDTVYSVRYITERVVEPTTNKVLTADAHTTTVESNYIKQGEAREQKMKDAYDDLKTQSTLQMQEASQEIARLKNRVSTLSHSIAEISSQKENLETLLANNEQMGAGTSVFSASSNGLEPFAKEINNAEDWMNQDLLSRDIHCMDALLLSDITSLVDQRLKEDYDEIPFDKKPPFSVKRFLKPKSFSIGMNAGLMVGSNLKYKNPVNKSYGLVSSIYFSENIRMNASASYFVGKSKIYDVDTYEELPMSVTPDNGRLQYIDVLGDGYMVDIGLEYLFVNRKMVVPFVGVGYGHSMHQYNEFDFEYSVDNSEVYLRVEDYDNKEKLNLGYLSIGVDLPLSKVFKAQINTSYYKDMTRNNSGFLHIRPSLKYTFNK